MSLAAFGVVSVLEQNKPHFYDQNFYFDFYNHFLNCYFALYLKRSDCRTPIYWFQVQKLLRTILEELVNGGKWNKNFTDTLLNGTEAYAQQLIKKGINIDLYNQSNSQCDYWDFSVKNLMPFSLRDFFGRKLESLCTTYQQPYPKLYDSYSTMPQQQINKETLCYTRYGRYTIDNPLNISIPNLSVTASCQAANQSPTKLISLIIVLSGFFASVFYLFILYRFTKIGSIYRPCVIQQGPKEDTEV